MNFQEDKERLYGIVEAADYLHVSPATVATWIRLGLASASRQDELGRNRFTQADLEEMRRRFHERQSSKQQRPQGPRDTEVPDHPER